MFNSLRIRLTLIFISLTLIPLIIVGVLITLRGYNTLQDQAIEFQEGLAQRTAISLESFFNERQAELFTLTNVYGLDALDVTNQRNVLSTLISSQPAYYQLTLVDANANETLRITRGEIITDRGLTNRADDALYQTVIADRNSNFGQVYFNESARDRLITLAIPIEDLFTGAISNVLIAEIRFQNIAEEVLRSLTLSEGEDVYVVDQNGIILSHLNPNFVIRESSFNLPDTRGRHAGLSNQDAILGFATVELANQQLLVVAETSYANAILLADDLSRISAIITLATLLVAGAIVIWSVNLVVDPIIKISRVATRVQKGDLTAKASEKGKGEIATLGRAFNQMTGELQRSLDELRLNIEQLEASNQERANLIKELQIAKRISDENSRLKSEFLATMSHELRTPLNAIEGFTSIMLSGMGVELSERAEDMLKRISSNSKRLLQLINDFLDLSRIESGRMELVKAHISPQQLAQKWEREVGVLANEKNIDFTVNISPDMPATILGDEDALSKIAINLLGNAFKFTPAGKVTLSVKSLDNQWTISVEDTGIGIPPHAREYIFDEFRQVDGSSKRLYGGTGLGLSLVQKLARAMGGNVVVQSEVGEGSTFTVALPLELPEDNKQGAIA